MNQANQSKTRTTDDEWHAEFDGELFLEDNLNQINIYLDIHMWNKQMFSTNVISMYMRLK